MGQVVGNELTTVDEIHRVVVVFFNTGRHGKDVRVENNVLRRETDFIDQHAVGTLTDFIFARFGIGLTLLVERHHHHRRAIAQAAFGFGDKLFFAFFQGNGVVGEAATALFKDAQAMLARIIDEKLFTARGVVGLWPAQRRGEDDIVVFSEDRSAELAVLHQLRQQTDKPNDQPNYSLADFVAPEGSVDDYVGAFVVTAGIEAEKLAHFYDAKHDDYNSILIKALADRFAEAFAERLHEIVRKELWGYAADE